MQIILKIGPRVSELQDPEKRHFPLKMGVGTTVAVPHCDQYQVTQLPCRHGYVYGLSGPFSSCLYKCLVVCFRRQHVGSRMDEYTRTGDTIRQPVQPQRHKGAPGAGSLTIFQGWKTLGFWEKFLGF